MSKKIESNLFIFSSLPRFYQQLLSGAFNYQQLGNQIVRQIKVAQAFRQIKRVQELSEVLVGSPIKEYQLAGQYYFAWSYCNKGRSQAGILESISEQSQSYKAQALLSRAAIEGYQGDVVSELYFYSEALKTRPNFNEYMLALKGIAIVKSKEGRHKAALKDIEKLIPLIKHMEPVSYYDVLNSYAVELGEAGRFYEARNVSNLVLASPFASAYPEWRETWDEIHLKAYRSPRSVVSFAQRSTATILQLPEREPSPDATRPPMQPAQVLSLLDWKNKMVKEPNGENPTDTLPDDMTGQDMAMKLVEMITQNKNDEDKLRMILEYANQIFSRRDKKE